MADHVSATDSHVKNRDIAAKIVCLLFALILWIYVMDVENPEWEAVVEGVPVELINTDEIMLDHDLTIYGGYSDTVDITLRGRKNQISGITAEDIKARVDVSEISEAGEYPLPIKVNVPSDAEIVTSSIDTVTVLVDRRDRITLDVKPRYSKLQIDQTYTLGDPILSVASVTVTGPSRYLSNIDHAEALIPELGQITGSTTVYSSISLIDRDGATVTNPYVSVSNSEVIINIPVYAKKTVPITVSYKWGRYNDENVEVTLDRETLAVRGEASVIDKLDSIVLTPIDEKSIFEDEMSYDEIIELPEGVENLEGIEKVTVTVKNKRTMTRTLIIPTNAINVNNPEGVLYTFSQDSLTITLRGDPSELYLVSYENVTATIDLAAYKTDQSVTAKIPVTFEFNSTSTVYELGEYSVDVTIGGNTAE